MPTPETGKFWRMGHACPSLAYTHRQKENTHTYKEGCGVPTWSNITLPQRRKEEQGRKSEKETLSQVGSGGWVGPSQATPCPHPPTCLFFYATCLLLSISTFPTAAANAFSLHCTHTPLLPPHLITLFYFIPTYLLPGEARR